MKRTSFVCYGAQGSKDALVYQEIPGRDGGEEFFLFLSPGVPEQEAMLRTLFREAVSASRLGAPAHYFSRFLEQFGALAAEAGGEGDVLDGVLIMIEIRRGNAVHVLCNRDAVLVHGDGRTGRRGSAESLKDFSEVPIGRARDQGDLFRRAPEDMFSLYRFTLAEGEHTVILVPSNEFVARYDESLRNSVFFPSFEFPRDMGMDLAVSRSFPALHWNGGQAEEAARSEERSVSGRTRVNVPLVVGALAGAVAIVILIGSLVTHEKTRGPEQPNALLDAADAARKDSSDPGGVEGSSTIVEGEPAVVERGRRLDLQEAWKRAFEAPVTSSARYCRGRIYFGCRDGYLYAFTAAGELAWKYRSGGGIGASPCCAEDRIIAADYRGALFCLDANSGKALWSFSTRSKIVSTPEHFDDIVFAGTTDGRILAVRLADGRKLWDRKIGPSIRASLAAGKDYVLAVTTDGTMVRLDRRGRIIWKTNVGAGVASSPACDEERDLVVIGAKDGAVHALSLSKGKRVWRYPADSAVDGSPLCGRDAIYIGSKSGTLYSLSFEGTLRWKRDVGGAVLSKPLIAGGIVFVTTYTAELVAVDAASGETAAEYRASAPIYSSPVTDGKCVYFGSNGGVFYAVRLGAPAAS
ncbi:MAG: PQQ-binding-like beta-propeller repeat protein [Candidatus Krumholzibacteria bacterium]|nr:PQQ-binding-like beta-propeller repeat protein [Candidatus Krumholzibacteria bacterium]